MIAGTAATSRPRLRPPLRHLLPTIAAMWALASCGPAGGSGEPPWAKTHPGTPLVDFQSQAPGLCAITVRYPEEAPAALGYLGTTYVQVSRGPHVTAAAGHDLGHSSDWHLVLRDAGDILLITAASSYDYRPEPAC